MICLHCGEPAAETYHPECWRAKWEAHNREGCELMYEAHDAITTLKQGGVVDVSVACMELYGPDIEHARKKGAGGKSKDGVKS